jgi:hypothetical protein
LTRKPYGLARQDAFRYLDVEDSLLRDQMTFGVDLGDPQGERSGTSLQSGFQIQDDLGVMVRAAAGFARGAIAPPRIEAARPAAGCAGSAAE